MGLSQGLIAEIEREGASTERILQRVPSGQFDWRPHPKSMSLGELAWHIARLPALGVIGLRDGKRDIGGARPGPPKEGDVVAEFRRHLADLTSLLASMPDETLLHEKFSFVRGDELVASMPKLGFLRTVFMNHSIHHRGQLTVYLRLIDVPVPAMYGRSADEDGFGRL